MTPFDPCDNGSEPYLETLGTEAYARGADSEGAKDFDAILDALENPDAEHDLAELFPDRLAAAEVRGFFKHDPEGLALYLADVREARAEEAAEAEAEAAEAYFASRDRADRARAARADRAFARAACMRRPAHHHRAPRQRSTPRRAVRLAAVASAGDGPPPPEEPPAPTRPRDERPCAGGAP